jgi:Cu(I)/Ag(I) efflux system membrane fusion protein
VEPLRKARQSERENGAAAAKASYALAIPRSAVIDTGTRKIVFVESAPGVFDLREVTLGVLSSDDLYPVLGGLKEGDKVVTTGAFLLDSENRLNPAANSRQSAVGGGQ